APRILMCVPDVELQRGPPEEIVTYHRILTIESLTAHPARIQAIHPRDPYIGVVPRLVRVHVLRVIKPSISDYGLSQRYSGFRPVIFLTSIIVWSGRTPSPSLILFMYARSLRLISSLSALSRLRSAPIIATVRSTSALASN